MRADRRNSKAASPPGISPDPSSPSSFERRCGGYRPRLDAVDSFDHILGRFMNPSPGYNDVVVVTKPVGSDVTAALIEKGYQVAAITARHLVYIHGGDRETGRAGDDPPPPARRDAARPSRRGALSVTEAAEALGVSRSYAYELIHAGTLPHLRLGRRIVVPVSALDRLLDEASS